MNYYIEGNAAKADQIKAAFEAKGYSDKGFTFDVDDILFFTANNKHINVCPANGWLANIIKTHPDYQELKLPVKPKFKVGDWLQSGSIWARVRRVDTENRRYICDFDNVIPFKEQDFWHLVPNPKPHYNIANFHAGMPVLVRDFYKHNEWTYAIFSHYNKNHHETCRFMASGTGYWQCIPFEGNEHLLGTTDMCDEQYINW